MDLRSRAHPDDSLVERIRRRIVDGVHRGEMHTGDRLPSSRSLGEELDTDHRAVARAYRRLADRGMVEIRARSGAYLASLEPQWQIDPKTDYTASWMRDLGTEAWLRRIPLPALSSMVRDFLSARTLRAVFVESSQDPLEAVAHELERDFGLVVRSVLVPFSEPPDAPAPEEAEELVAAVAEAEIVVTSTFHTTRVRYAMQLGGCAPELVQMTLNPHWLALLQRTAAEKGLVVVGVDPGSEERFTLALDVPEGRLRFATLDSWRRDQDSRGAAVHATRAARTREPTLSEITLRKLPPVVSMESARSISGAIVSRHLAGRAPAAS